MFCVRKRMRDFSNLLRNYAIDNVSSKIKDTTIDSLLY